MLTADNARWCLLVILALLAAWGVIWWAGRERPIDWTAPASDIADLADDDPRALTQHGNEVPR